MLNRRGRGDRRDGRMMSPEATASGLETFFSDATVERRCVTISETAQTFRPSNFAGRTD